MKRYNCLICNSEFIKAKSYSNHIRYGCPSLRKAEIMIKKRKYIYTLLKNEKGKEKYRKYSKTQRLRYPEKIKARRILNNEIRKGNILKKPCEECGDIKSEGHHFKGYLFPLMVKWLCHKHHYLIHGVYYETKTI